MWNKTKHWREEIIGEKVLYNVELDNYLVNSGFLDNDYIDEDILNYLNDCINLKSYKLTINKKHNLCERILNEVKEMKFHKYLDIYRSEKRYIIILSNISVLIFYIKKGKTVDSMDFGFGRLSVYNGFDLNISEFDKKISGLLDNIKNETI